ncbi:MAG: hypothetical protein K1564_15925 [Candidatus Thiodiazotropha sp. (ex. Lucinisca nassula)]|nr:hypothetical protein [Candidatus Thiodiazotropha sp. (ex. Lucinisca nassula)]
MEHFAKGAFLMMTIMTLSAIADVYADAYLADDAGSLLFLSVWGRDTALQELLARLQLPRSENGIREFTLTNGEFKKLVRVANVDDLDKATLGVGLTTFGPLTQMWIFDKLALEPDLVNHRALMVHGIESHVNPWPLIKTVCPLPLLDEWKACFLSRCRQRQWIRPLENGAGIAGTIIELDDGLEPLITEMIQRGELTLPATA